jgi:hypothetical protein
MNSLTQQGNAQNKKAHARRSARNDGRLGLAFGGALEK